MPLGFQTRFGSKMEEEAFTPAIPIDLTQDNEFDLGIPPMTGNEYLRRVRNEALEIPAVVVAKRNFSKLNEKQNFHVQQNDGCLPAPEGLAPSAEWKQRQISNFARLRQEFIKYKTTHAKEIKEAKHKLPQSNDSNSWRRLCFGSFTNLNDNTDDLQDTKKNGFPPLLSIVAAMDQPCVEQILEYHVKLFEKTELTHRQGQWFYALLISIQKPLTPEACSSIRTLARRCSYLRGLIQSESDTQLVPLNLLICLVCKYFEQKDLEG